MTTPEARAARVIATALAMNAHGINSGMSGNVSIRSGDGMLITPSSVDYELMIESDVVAMDADGRWNDGNGRRPSSEWRFHLDIYAARPDVEAIVHCHPTAATAIAAHGRGIGPFHYMIGVAGGNSIRCAPYATFGTPELSAHAVEALTGRKACLMAHHGIIAVGADLKQALGIAVEVEVLAAQYLAALAIGEPPELTDAQMDEVLEKMNSGPGYGSSATLAEGKGN